MRTKENLVNPVSDYYLYQPSTIASRVYLYPKEIGYFFYEPGYWRSRIQYDSFLLMYIAKEPARFSFQISSITIQDIYVCLNNIYMIKEIVPHK